LDLEGATRTSELRLCDYLVLARFDQRAREGASSPSHEECLGKLFC